MATEPTEARHSSPDPREHGSGQQRLDAAYDKLEGLSPSPLARAIRWLRDPKGKWVRIPLGLAIIAANLFGPVVPVLGIEFVPLGLLLIAQDFPPLRKPVADLTLWAEGKLEAHQRRKARRHR